MSETDNQKDEQATSASEGAPPVAPEPVAETSSPDEAAVAAEAPAEPVAPAEVSADAPADPEVSAPAEVSADAPAGEEASAEAQPPAEGEAEGEAEASEVSAVAEGEDGGEDGEDPQRPSSAPELPEDEMSFAEMFELAEKQARERRKAQKAAAVRRGGGDELRPGAVVEAKIVGVSGDSVFLDLGGKAEGVMPQSDLLNEEGKFEGKEGDKVEARVLSTEGGTIRLGKAMGHESVRNREAVRQAFDAGLPVEGRVTGQNKGGLDIEVGGLRAFCPISQVDVRYCKDPGIFIGQKLVFKVTEFKDRGRNIVVSRRVLLEEEQKLKAAELVETLEVGQKITGTITSLRDYGAFVDLGGIEGLVHVSEISHGRISKPGDALNAGEDVEVVILKLEDAKKGGKKISLSIKALADDPWDTAQRTLKEAQKITGTVLRIQPFGAFVEILPGVDGLIHVSNMSNERIRDPRELVKEGDEVEATIVGLDWKKRRIGLSLVKTPQELAREVAAGKVYEGTIDRIESFGLFVKLPTGARGLVPLPETGTQRGADLKKEFKAGAAVKVTVLAGPGNGRSG